MAPPTTKQGASDRTRTLLTALGACVFTFVFLSWSAHRNAPTSPSAERVAQYLPALSLANDADSNLNSYSLEYRHEVERLTSPPSLAIHSPTLTFDHIYVLSLPSREDRRRDMTQLANALGITIEFIDARDQHDPAFEWIAERVAETRNLRRTAIARARKVSPSTVGGLHIAGDWSSPFPNPKDPSKRFAPYPAPTSLALRKQLDKTRSKHWVQHFETLDRQGRLDQLKPLSRGRINVTDLLWDPLERVRVRQVTPGVMSTWYGQTRAMQRIVERGDKTALVLEDDVDLEWDLERLWATVERKLPQTGTDAWDMAYLGHCWGAENSKPQYLHPLLHPSTGPMCLHAYALTLSGAKRVLSELSSPWIAYQTAVDLALPTLIHFSLINSYSITPPLVVQRKDGPSDLQRGNGSRWRGVLRDSTHERILRDQGTWHEGWEDVWDPNRIDPATQLRCGTPL